LGFPFIYVVSGIPMGMEIDRCLKYLQVNEPARRGIPVRNLVDILRPCPAGPKERVAGADS
jgi:hypothetical protein